MTHTEVDGEVSYIDGPAGRIAYRRTGVGPPLVLLHPLALSGRIWRPFASLLADHCDVVCPDARGHGASDWDGRAFTMADMAADVRALIDGLRLDSVDLLGMSMGGSTAIIAAADIADRVGHLVLVDTTAWYGPDAPATWAARARMVLARSRRQQIPFQTSRWFTDAFRHRCAPEVRRIVNIFLQADSAAHSAACNAMGDMDSRHLLARISAPTLVLTGEEDYATPIAMGQELAANIPRAQFLPLAGLRHLSIVERPGLASTVRAHLAGSAPEPASADRGCGCAGRTPAPAGSGR